MLITEMLMKVGEQLSLIRGPVESLDPPPGSPPSSTRISQLLYDLNPKVRKSFPWPLTPCVSA
jgi:hypothetical protein